MFCALVLYRPIVRIWRLRVVRPRLRTACGVLALRYSFSVALLTETSVAWADRITAISNSKLDLKLSSVDGLPCVRAKILKIFSLLVGFM